MPLETLRREIFEKTSAFKSPRQDFLSRTIYLILTPSMGHLRDWFHSWFPDSDDSIRYIHPWYTVERNLKPDKFKQILTSIFLEAFSVETSNKLISKGYQLLNTANQVILMGDMTEEETAEHLKLVQETFSEIIGKFGQHESPVYFTGIFLCRNLTSNNGNVVLKSCSELKNKLMSCSTNLDRLFLIDIANLAGSIVSKEKDMHFLIGQLLYVLSRKPMDFIHEQNPSAFGEWLRRTRPDEGQCNGFSGISILNPIDQLLETLLIVKGGEVLDKAFFSNTDEGRIDYYTKSLINNTHLNSSEVFGKMLQKNENISLIDPFKNVEDTNSAWDVDNPDDFTTFIDTLDAHLADDALENKKMIEASGEFLLDNFRYELLEHINAVISNESGGLMMAESILAKLKKAITEMIPEKGSDKPFPDISNLIHILGVLSQKGPRKASVIARGTVLTLAAMAGLGASGAILDAPFIAFTILTVFAVGSATVYWYGSKNSIEKMVSDIWKKLFEKWQILMNKVIEDILIQLLPQYIAEIDDMINRVQASQKRLREVVAFFRTEYTATLPEHSSFWLYAVNDRDNFIRYLPQIQTNNQEIASAYLKEDKPLELWNRTAPVNAAELNEWEWTLGEKIAMRLLPTSNNIIDLSVSKLLNDAPNQKRSFLELLKGSALPFLCVKPGTPRFAPQAIVEIQDEDNNLYTKIEESVGGSFSVMDRKRALSPYRISLFSFAENIEIDSLKAGG